MEGYRDFLSSEYYKYPALMPSSSFIDGKAPAKVKGVRLVEDEDGAMLLWLVDENAGRDVMDTPHRFVVYCFAKGAFVSSKSLKAKPILYSFAKSLSTSLVVPVYDFDS